MTACIHTKIALMDIATVLCFALCCCDGAVFDVGLGTARLGTAWHGTARQALLIKMFEDEPDGGSGVSLSLAELLAQKGEPQLVFANDSARGASKAIARGRKAVSLSLCCVVQVRLGVSFC